MKWQHATVPILWYENAAGERWNPPDRYAGDPPPPDGFEYQHFRNPCELHDSICTSEGRLATGCQTWSPNLVVNMVRPRLWTRLRQLLRCAWLPPLHTLGDAIIITATSCERCINVLHYRYVTGDGYAYGSPEWLRCPTECDYCRLDPKRPTRPEVLNHVQPAKSAVIDAVCPLCGADALFTTSSESVKCAACGADVAGPPFDADV